MNKVNIFSEIHKIWKNHPHKFDIYFVDVKSMYVIFSKLWLSQSLERVGLIEYIDKLGTVTYASIAILFLPKLQLWVKKIISAYICM